MAVDTVNGNKAWSKTIDKEIETLIKTECFNFTEPGYNPGKGFKEYSLRMIFDIKLYRKFKTRLVTGDHRIDPGQLSTRATVVKSVSVRLLNIIVHHYNLKTLCGDIGNVFINIFTKKISVVLVQNLDSTKKQLLLLKKSCMV